MLDLPLTYRLLDALPARTRIILLGDRDQLASVAAGNVLGDITGHGNPIGYSQSLRRMLALTLGCPVENLPSVDSPAPISDSIALLTQSYRFDPKSGIGQLASLINRGDGIGAVEILKQASSSLSLRSPTGNSIEPSTLDWVIQSFRSVVASETVSQALHTFERTRILCAIHSGPFGVDQLNQMITAAIHPNQPFRQGEDYHGKPVLINANDYELNLFNGDTGLLWRDEAGVLQACFRGEDQSIRQLPIHSLPDHMTAWAMTVHKSQGSEFESVLLVLPDDEESRAISRELLYTGVTRARQKLQILGSTKVLVSACEKLTRRSSGLAKKLGWEHL
jgi:exodeoxyribonuclease V alpha subunit